MMKRYDFSITRWQNLSPLAKCSALALATLVIVSLVFPFFAMAQSNSDQDLRDSLYFFSMKPVVIGEGSQVIHVSSKRWNMDSQVTIDASSECSDTYGMSFDTALPATAQITERYDADNNGRTHFPLSVTPGTVASGISESDSTCMISISDGAYTIERPLRQILASDKNVITLAEGPEVISGTNAISWESQGHPPGVWFNGGEDVYVSSWATLYKIPSFVEHNWNILYSDDHDHPVEASTGNIPDYWVDDGYHYCAYINFNTEMQSPETCYNVGSMVEPVRPTRAPLPTKQPTPTPMPVPPGIVEYKWADSHCNKVVDGYVQPMSHTTGNLTDGFVTTYSLRYNCSETRYNVVKNDAGQWVWDDPALPSDVNGQVYSAEPNVGSPMPGMNPFLLSPTPNKVTVPDNGTAMEFTVHVPEPAIVKVNPGLGANSGRLVLKLMASEPYDNPCDRGLTKNERLNVEDGQTIWISACANDKGSGEIEISRQSDGSYVRRYRLPVEKTNEPFEGEPQQVVIPAPPVFKPFRADSHSMTIGWFAPTNVSEHSIKRYDVQYRESGASDWIEHGSDSVAIRRAVSTDIDANVRAGDTVISVQSVDGIREDDTITLRQITDFGFIGSLARGYSAGETTFTLDDASGFNTNDSVLFDGNGDNAETLIVASASSTQITTTTASANAHAKFTEVRRHGSEITEDLEVMYVDTSNNDIRTMTGAANAYSAAARTTVYRAKVAEENLRFLQGYTKISGLESTQNYDYRIRAIADQVGQWAVGSGATTANPAIVNVPTEPVEIEENLPIGSWVLKILAFNDSGPHSLIQLSLGGPDASAFSISGEGQVATSVVLDYEAQSTYNFTINASLPGDGTPTTADVVVHVVDVEELPAKPYTPELVSVSETSAEIRWDVRDNAGRPPIVGYDIRYGLEPGTWFEYTHNGTATTATITGLEGGQDYAVEVRSRNVDGVSDWSGSLEVTTTAPSTNNRSLGQVNSGRDTERGTSGAPATGDTSQSPYQELGWESADNDEVTEWEFVSSALGEYEDAWCNKVRNGVVQPTYIYGDPTLKYECSIIGYRVYPMSGGSWMWNDTGLPLHVNGTVYASPGAQN